MLLMLLKVRQVTTQSIHTLPSLDILTVYEIICMLNPFKHNISIQSSLHAPMNRSQIHMTTMFTAVITTSSVIKILDYSQIRLLFCSVTQSLK